jgi:hypothetical protein
LPDAIPPVSPITCVTSLDYHAGRMRRLAPTFALVAVAVTVALGAAVGVAHAARRDWTGSAACGACHPQELAAWQTTPHAGTRVRFARTAPEARCLACHGTGEAPAGPAIAVEVGCEACHGAGTGYAPDDVMRDRPLALTLGLTDLSTPGKRTALCASCHARATTERPFDPTAPVHGARS